MKLIVSKRVFLTLPDAVADDLELWAEAEGNKAASLAGFIVELAVRQAREQGKIPKRPSVNYVSIDSVEDLEQLISQTWKTLIESSGISLQRLELLRDSKSEPSEVEILRIALALGLPESFVSNLPLRSRGKQSNGSTS